MAVLISSEKPVGIPCGWIPVRILVVNGPMLPRVEEEEGQSIILQERQAKAQIKVFNIVH
jgi:hypothetical protein